MIVPGLARNLMLDQPTRGLEIEHGDHRLQERGVHPLAFPGLLALEQREEMEGDSTALGFDFLNLHRNKRSMTLDLKHPRGVEIIKKIAARADVVVENFRPDVKERLGIDYKALRKVNPRLVYASISGFGQDWPYRERPGFDQIAQGMGGLMSITGLPGQGPVRVGIPIDDLTAGNLLALGIMMAIFDRERTGVGRWVTTSLLEAQIFMLDFQASRWLIAKEVAPPPGLGEHTGAVLKEFGFSAKEIAKLREADAI